MNVQIIRMRISEQMKSTGFLLLVTLIMIMSIGCTKVHQSKQYEPNWESLKQVPIPQWLEDAKFGILFTGDLIAYWLKYLGKPRAIMPNTYLPGCTGMKGIIKYC